MPGTVIGIDLGTTNCRVAILEGEQLIVIPNSLGQRTTRNVVALTPAGEWIVGAPAEAYYEAAPETAIPGITRFLGLPRSSPTFQEQFAGCAFQTEGEENQEPTVLLQGKTFTFEEILAEIFKKLKWTAECYLGEEVRNAVVALSALLTPAVNEQIKRSAGAAGLNVLRILTSAVSASVAYGFKLRQEKSILVFDFGGGFCSSAVVNFGEGVFDVLSAEEVWQVSGNSIDKHVAAHLSTEFAKDTGIELEGNRIALERLQIAAEKAKILLSSSDETDVYIPLIAQDSTGRARNLRTRLSREKLEAICLMLIGNVQDICVKNLHASGLKLEEIDEVLLIGGMSRMPLVQKSFTEWFGNKTKINSTAEDLVSRGAAIQGAVLKGDIKDLLLLDVIPISVGVETLNGRFNVLIPKNFKIPTRRSMLLSTVHHGQSSVYLHFLAGENLSAADNNTLAGLNLAVVPGPKGAAKIEVTADIDANGVLEFSARDLTSGLERSIRINGPTGVSREEALRLATESPVK